eukprot:11196631-Lingulodinium_polyedra.AAC.1
MERHYCNPRSRHGGGDGSAVPSEAPPLEDELCRAPAGDSARSPSPALALWLEDFGVASAGLHPEEAAGWLA